MKKFLFNTYVKLCLVWVILALGVQVSMIFLQFANPKLAESIAKQVTWKLDDRFKK